MSATTHDLPTEPTRSPERCLDVENLGITYGGATPSVAGVTLQLREGEILGIIGESGCGKSSIGLAMLGLLPATAEVTADTFTVAGHDYIDETEDRMRQIRGNDVSMIFQEPMSALNPLIRIGDQIEEVLLLHNPMSRAEASRRALEMLRLVQVPEPELRMKQFPHQLSGGMRQRIVIAIAMAAEPKVLIADEPTTALDVTVQAQIMELLKELQEEVGMGLILITHDLGVVADVADKIAVMYSGRIVESAPVREIYRQPAHPYTKGLLESIPRVDMKGRELFAIKGLPPNLLRLPTGCEFAPRCPYALEKCVAERPATREIAPLRTVSCHRAEEVFRGDVD